MSVMDQEERNRTEKGIRIGRGAPGGKKRKEFGGGGRNLSLVGRFVSLGSPGQP